MFKTKIWVKTFINIMHLLMTTFQLSLSTDLAINDMKFDIISSTYLSNLPTCNYYSPKSQRYATTSKISCATACSKHEWCLYFLYYKNGVESPSLVQNTCILAIAHYAIIIGDLNSLTLSSLSSNGQNQLYNYYLKETTLPYLYTDIKKLQQEAFDFCASIGRKLLEYETQYELHQFTSVLESVSSLPTDGFHTSGKSVGGVWKWGSSGRAMPSWVWAPGEPQAQACTMFYTQGPRLYKLNDIHCTKTIRNYVCIHKN